MKDYPHGVLNTYNNRNCRCDPCRQANSDYWRERKRAYRGFIPENCEICGSSGKLAWDHHHASNSHRGWLCRNCNTLIGKFKESPEIMRAAITYLEAHNDRTV